MAQAGQHHSQGLRVDRQKLRITVGTGMPAAVMYKGRAECPRRTGTAWVAVRHRFGHPDHPNAELGMRLRAQARAAGGAEIGIAADHQQAQPVAWDLGQG